MDLSIIIPNFNTKKLTLDCVGSIKKNTKGIEYEIIVVDNASKEIPSGDFKLIRNIKNLGFAAANNQGLKIAKGRYVLFLNSDTEVSDNVLGEMISWMDKNPKAGVASCRLLGKDGSLQPTGGYFPDIFRVFAWMTFLDDLPLVNSLFKSFHPHKNTYLNMRQQDWLTGAFLMTRKDIVKKAGNWDEDYFMYVEEVDLCYRIKKMGWEVWYLPQWSIAHFGGASSKISEFPLLSEYESIKKFYKKFYPSWQYSILRMLLKIGALGRMVVFAILEGRKGLETYAKAFKKA